MEYIIELLLLRIFETKIKQDDEFKLLGKLFSAEFKWKNPKTNQWIIRSILTPQMWFNPDYALAFYYGPSRHVGTYMRNLADFGTHHPDIDRDYVSVPKSSKSFIYFAFLSLITNPIA